MALNHKVFDFGEGRELNISTDTFYDNVSLSDGLTIEGYFKNMSFPDKEEPDSWFNTSIFFVLFLEDGAKKTVLLRPKHFNIDDDSQFYLKCNSDGGRDGYPVVNKNTPIFIDLSLLVGNIHISINLDYFLSYIKDKNNERRYTLSSNAIHNYYIVPIIQKEKDIYLVSLHDFVDNDGAGCQDKKTIGAILSPGGSEYHTDNLYFYEHMISLLNHNGMLLSRLGDLRNDPPIVMTAVMNNGLALQFASEPMRNDKSIVMAAVTNNGLALQFASEPMRNHDGVLIGALINNTDALQYADKLKKNSKFILTLLLDPSIKISYLKHIPDDLKRNIGFIKKLVDINGLALKYIDRVIKNNLSVVEIAVKQNGLALQFASDTLKDNESIVKDAVMNNGLALQFASKTMRNHPIVMTAVMNNGLALEFASKTMRNFSPIVMTAVMTHGLALEFASDTLKDNESIVKDAVKQNGLALQFASERIQDKYPNPLAHPPPPTGGSGGGAGSSGDAGGGSGGGAGSSGDAGGGSGGGAGGDLIGGHLTRKKSRKQKNRRSRRKPLKKNKKRSIRKNKKKTRRRRRKQTIIR
jgi:intracellular sulfur oxidation DsrE/DsrF family protein